MNQTVGILIFLVAMYGLYSFFYPIELRMRNVLRTEMKLWMKGDLVSKRHEQLKKMIWNQTNTIK